MSKLKWDKKPLSEIEENELVPSIILCDMVRTHNTQMNRWINEGKIPFKKGRNGNRQCKMIKVLPLTKMVALLKNCGMIDYKLEQLSTEGYERNEAMNGEEKAAVKNKPDPKPDPKPSKRNKPGPKPGRRKPKLSANNGFAETKKILELSKKHDKDLEALMEILADAVEAGLVAAI